MSMMTMIKKIYLKINQMEIHWKYLMVKDFSYEIFE